MPKAKIVPDQFLQILLDACEDRRYPHRDQVIVLLSFKAGLRQMEIANIRRGAVLDSEGQVADTIELSKKWCKKGSARTIPMHPKLKVYIKDLFRKVPGNLDHPLILSERIMTDENAQIKPMHPNSIGNFFYKLYRKVGLIGCSSHSGRRTFGTKAAHLIKDIENVTLREVQLLLGHKSLESTQEYIEATTEGKRSIIDNL